MIMVCGIVNRTWWRLKTFLFPWVDQTKRPPPAPRMREAEDMLRTAIFDLREISRK
jgi:hypothetical protein